MSTKVWMQWEYELPEEERPQWEELFEKVADTVLRSEGVSLPTEVELNVVGDEEIHELNKEYRKVDRATDVLSFPLCNLVPGQAQEGLAEEETDPESGRVCLGNIVLSWDHVQAQAKEYGHSIRREAAFLVIHSMLHLLGYDHMEAQEEQEMIARQKEILEILGIPREAEHE